MLYENLIGLDMYLEPYKNTKINVTPTVNQTEVLYVNENNDSLYSNLTTGIATINRLINYSSNYTDYLLLYNDESEIMLKDFVITKDKLTFAINPHKPTKYKIRAKSESASNYDGSNVFNFALTGRTVHKVILNNKLLKPTQYTANTTSITVNSDVIDAWFNSLTIIHYSTDQTIIESFYLSYLGVDKVYDIDSATCEPDFFDNMINITNINSLSDTITPTEIDLKSSAMELSVEKCVTDYSNTISLQTHENFTFVDEIGLFRFLAYDKLADKLTYYTNCQFNPTVNKSYDKSVNMKTYTIRFEDRIEVLGTNGVLYGEGLYGDGLYNGAKVYSAIYKGAL